MAPDRSGRKVVGRTSLIVALAAALAFASMATVAFAFDHNLSRTLARTRGTLASTQASLATTKAGLASTRSQLSRTEGALHHSQAQVDALQTRVSTLKAQVAGLEGRLSNSQSLLHASQQINNETATVADSLKSCVDATQTFERDFTTELETGFFSSLVTDEANRADAACAQANSDYNTLLSELSLANSTTT